MENSLNSSIRERNWRENWNNYNSLTSNLLRPVRLLMEIDSTIYNQIILITIFFHCKSEII